MLNTARDCYLQNLKIGVGNGKMEKASQIIAYWFIVHYNKTASTRMFSNTNQSIEQSDL